MANGPPSAGQPDPPAHPCPHETPPGKYCAECRRFMRLDERPFVEMVASAARAVPGLLPRDALFVTFGAVLLRMTARSLSAGQKLAPSEDETPARDTLKRLVGCVNQSLSMVASRLPDALKREGHDPGLLRKARLLCKPFPPMDELPPPERRVAEKLVRPLVDASAEFYMSFREWRIDRLAAAEDAGRRAAKPALDALWQAQGAANQAACGDIVLPADDHFALLLGQTRDQAHLSASMDGRDQGGEPRDAGDMLLGLLLGPVVKGPYETMAGGIAANLGTAPGRDARAAGKRAGASRPGRRADDPDRPKAELAAQEGVEPTRELGEALPGPEMPIDPRLAEALDALDADRVRRALLVLQARCEGLGPEYKAGFIYESERRYGKTGHKNGRSLTDLAQEHRTTTKRIRTAAAWVAQEIDAMVAP